MIVGLQGGQKPLTVLLQQGSQIAPIMSQAGIGIGGLAREVGLMAVNFGKAHPVLLLVTAAAGAVAGVMGMVTAEINKTSKTTVTMGDVMLGTFDVIKEAVSSRVSAATRASTEKALRRRNAISNKGSSTMAARRVFPTDLPCHSGLASALHNLNARF